MKRFLLGGGVLVVLALTVFYAQSQPVTVSKAGVAAPANELLIEPESKNPWTHLRLNESPDQFQFAVVSDRTGGHRPKVFSRAVQQINLLQPAFVMSVGDLIEGYTQKPEQINKEWDEFDSFTRQLQMPFFYVPGNHDLSNELMLEKWKQRYGRRHYHFVYKNTLFLAVNCEDPPGKLAISEGQRADIKKALDENRGVRWTFVFIHKPIWLASDLESNGWLDVETMLAGRKYTVFCGHVHRYQKFIRNGMNYYQLATTGGVSRMRGVEYGEFDQVAWVTMKPTGPVIANVIIDGVLPENLQAFPSDEEGYQRELQPTHPAQAKVVRNGMPVAAATVTLYKPGIPMKSQPTAVADGLTNDSGETRLTTYTAFDGAPVGEYLVTIVQTGGYRVPGNLDTLNKLPKKYSSPSTTPLRANVTATGPNQFLFEIRE